jgi:FAD synthetase
VKRKVLVFGTFDPLHRGHMSFFRQAKAKGNELWVVVTRDSALRFLKKREPRQNEDKRLQILKGLPEVSGAQLGDEWPVDDPFRLLGEMEFDVIALGYDQEPGEEEVKRELFKRGKEGVEVIRLQSYYPQKYKSSRL